MSAEAQYLWASRISQRHTHQTIPSGKWTRIKWEDLIITGDINWSLMPDGATMRIPQDEMSRGIFATSASVAFEPWIAGTKSLLPAHARKVRIVYGIIDPLEEAQNLFAPANGAESSGEFNPAKHLPPAEPLIGDNAIDVLPPAYIQAGISPDHPSDLSMYVEAFQNSGHDVRTVTYGGASTVGDNPMSRAYLGAAPLLMVYRLGKW